MRTKNVDTTPTDARSLRNRAEALLRAKPADLPTLPTADVQALVHELNVHQAELEIQNEELRQAQVELAHSRDRYADLYDFAPASYITLDRAGRILEANLAAATLLGIERQNLVGENISQFVVRQSQDEYFLHRRAVLAGGAKQVGELGMHTADGTPLVVRLESIAFGDGNERQCRTALIDITQRKAAEEALQRVNETLEQRVTLQTREVKLLAEALANLGEGVLVTNDHFDWPGPKIIYVNEALCRITGYAAAELIGQTPRILQGERTDKQTISRLRRDLSRKRPHACEVVNYRKDGTPYDAELFITPLFDAAGNHTNFIAVHRDVTHRKQAERALRESEERLRAILQAAADAIITIDPRGIIDSVNPATVRMFGYPQHELVGRNVKLLMPPPYSDEHDGYIARYLRTGDARIIGSSRELVGLHKDGSTFPIGLAISEIDHLHMFTGIIRDLTAVRELQKHVLEIAAEEQRRIGQELHDGTGQELTGLSLFAGTLLEIINNLPRREAEGKAARLLEEADFRRLQTTAARLSRGLAEANRHVHLLSHGIMPVQVDAEGLRSALEELVAVTDAQDNVDCRFKCFGSVAVANNTTATHLYRIAQEALHNAVRHGQAEQIRISLSQKQDHVTLEVRDNGIGFDSAAPHHLGPAGAGMGLHTMAYRAGMIGGVLHIDSQEEQGTTVRCTVLRGGG